MSDVLNPISALQRECAKQLTGTERESETPKTRFGAKKANIVQNTYADVPTQTGASFLASSPLEQAI